MRDEKERAAAAAGRGVRVNARIDGPDQAPTEERETARRGDGRAAAVIRSAGNAGNAADRRSPDAGDGQADLDGDERPCAHCGRPVPQRNAAGRPFRYCRDNDGECQRAARNARLRHRASPGLSGQVARAFEVAERLDQVVETLVEALHDEVSPAGVERQIAHVRAEAAAGVLTAHAERDDARAAAQQALAAAKAAETATRAAEAVAAAAREETATAHAVADDARRDADTVRQAAEHATDQARHSVRQAKEEAAVLVAEAHHAAAQSISAAQRDAAQRVDAAQAAARDADAAAAVATVERDAARREAATEAALRAEAYRERDTARAAADTAGRDRETLERDLAGRADEATRLRRHLEQAQAGRRGAAARGQHADAG